MSQEFINGILIGAGTTAFGFMLTILWDVWKTRQRKQELQSSLLCLLKDELEYNFLIVQHNKSLVEKELRCLDKNQSIVNALDVPRMDFWEVFKMNYDDRFLSAEKLKILKNIYSVTHSIIVNIESRENYRVSNAAMTNFSTRMSKYDEILLGLFREFEQHYSSFFRPKK